MNKFKRWYYELTEKQTKTIALISAIIFYILFGGYTFSPSTSDSNMPLLFMIFLFFACVGMSLCVYTIIYALLWYSPYKRKYLHKKEHDEIIPIVRAKFGLCPEFREILYFPNKTDYDFVDFPNLLNQLGVKYFAREMDGVILVSIRNTAGKELESHKIDDYNFFDSNFKPKE